VLYNPLSWPRHEGVRVPVAAEQDYTVTGTKDPKTTTNCLHYLPAAPFSSNSTLSGGPLRKSLPSCVGPYWGRQHTGVTGSWLMEFCTAHRPSTHYLLAPCAAVPPPPGPRGVRVLLQLPPLPPFTQQLWQATNLPPPLLAHPPSPLCQGPGVSLSLCRCCRCPPSLNSCGRHPT
jgi:hypothetical protein